MPRTQHQSFIGIFLKKNWSVLTMIITALVIGFLVGSKAHELLLPNLIPNIFNVDSKNETTTWSTYYSRSEGLSFRYPQDWTLKTIGSVDPNADAAQIISPSGTIIEYSSVVDGLGGGCDPGDCPLVETRIIQKIGDTGAGKSFFIVERIVDAESQIGVMSEEVLPQEGTEKAFPYYLTFINRKGGSAWLKTTHLVPEDKDAVFKIFSTMWY